MNINYNNLNNLNNLNNHNSSNDNDYSQLNKWNWGAFMFSVFWGIGNRCYLPLLCLIPGVNLVMMFICGAYGNRWAYNAGEYRSVKEFTNVQRSWNAAGKASFVISIIVLILYTIIIIASLASGTHTTNSYGRYSF